MMTSREATCAHALARVGAVVVPVVVVVVTDVVGRVAASAAAGRPVNGGPLCRASAVGVRGWREAAAGPAKVRAGGETSRNGAGLARDGREAVASSVPSARATWAAIWWSTASARRHTTPCAAKTIGTYKRPRWEHNTAVCWWAMATGSAQGLCGNLGGGLRVSSPQMR